MERTVEVVGELGLHARAAARLVQTAKRFRAEIKVAKGGREADARSILDILLLGAGCGATLVVRCLGEDEAAAMTAVCELFANGFRDES